MTNLSQSVIKLSQIVNLGQRIKYYGLLTADRGSFYAKKRQLFHYKRNVGGIVFFFYRELVGGTVAQRLNLAY